MHIRSCAEGEKWRACSHECISERRLPAQQRNRAAAVSRTRGTAAHLRLPHASQRRRHRLRPPLQQSGGNLAGRRPLQVAGHARIGHVPSASAPATRQPYEKFMAWAATLPHTLRNPLYHWTHLELQRYFGITELLNVTTRSRHLEARQRGAAGRAVRPRRFCGSFASTPSAPPTIRWTISVRIGRFMRQTPSILLFPVLAYRA